MGTRTGSQPLFGGIDRQRALRPFEATTLLALRKALRNGAVWVVHGMVYCRRNAMLIPDVDWEYQRWRWFQHLSLPLQASGYTPQLLVNLEVGLTPLAEAVEAGEVDVDNQGVHLQALETEEVPPDLEATKQALFKEVGVVQLPALLMALDHEIRFIWRSLGCAPTTERELLTACAALLAHGTELDAAGVALETFLLTAVSWDPILASYGMGRCRLRGVRGRRSGHVRRAEPWHHSGRALRLAARICSSTYASPRARVRFPPSWSFNTRAGSISSWKK